MILADVFEWFVSMVRTQTDMTTPVCRVTNFTKDRVTAGASHLGVSDETTSVH